MWISTGVYSDFKPLCYAKRLSCCFTIPANSVLSPPALGRSEWKKVAATQHSQEQEITTEHLALCSKQLFSKSGWYLYWFIQIRCVGIYWGVKICLNLSSMKRSRWSIVLFPANAMLIILWVTPYEIIHFHSLQQYFSLCLWTNKQSTMKRTFQATKLLVTSGFIRSIMSSWYHWKKGQAAPDTALGAQNFRQKSSYQLCEFALEDVQGQS